MTMLCTDVEASRVADLLDEPEIGDDETIPVLRNPNVSRTEITMDVIFRVDQCETFGQTENADKLVRERISVFSFTHFLRPIHQV